MKVGSAFLQTFAVQVTQPARSLTTGVLIARGLGPEGQGGYAVFTAAVGLGVILGSLGQYEGHVFSSEGQGRAGRLLLTRSLVQGSALALLLFAALPALRRVLGWEGASSVVLFFPIVLSLEVEAQLLRGINLGQHRISAFNLTTL